MVSCLSVLAKVKEGGENILGSLFLILCLISMPAFRFSRRQPIVLVVINVILFFVLGSHWWLWVTFVYCLMAWFFAECLYEAFG